MKLFNFLARFAFCFLLLMAFELLILTEAFNFSDYEFENWTTQIALLILIARISAKEWFPNH